MGRRISVFRLNFYKACLAFVLFAFTVVFILQDVSVYQKLISEKPQVIFYLLVSGVSGFAIGDLFTFRAFAMMGAARGLMIQCFAPIMVAIYSRWILHTTLAPQKVLGLFFLVACVFSLSFDKKQKLPFSWHAVFLCCIGVICDSFGVTLSKLSFNTMPELTSAHANVMRIGISIPVVFFLCRLRKKPIVPTDLTVKQIALIVTGACTGTFLALFLYLYAISHGEAAIIAGVGSLTPLYAATVEHIRDKIWPSFFMLLSIFFMFCGIYLLV